MTAVKSKPKKGLINYDTFKKWAADAGWGGLSVKKMTAQFPDTHEHQLVAFKARWDVERKA